MKVNDAATRPYFAKLLAVGYPVILSIEYSAAKAGDSKLFQNPAWPIGFLIWYGLLLGVSYALFRKRPLWQIALFWALAGPLIEIVLFRGHILITDFFYSVMMAFPFWLARRWNAATKKPN